MPTYTPGMDNRAIRTGLHPCPLCGEPSVPAWREARMSAVEVRDAVVPGSGDWTWLDEDRAMLVHPHLGKLRALIALFSAGNWSCAEKYKRESQWITLGNDGRLWDGHHRIVAAWIVAPHRPLLVRRWS